MSFLHFWLTRCPLGFSSVHFSLARLVLLHLSQPNPLRWWDNAESIDIKECIFLSHQFCSAGDLCQCYPQSFPGLKLEATTLQSPYLFHFNCITFPSVSDLHCRVSDGPEAKCSGPQIGNEIRHTCQLVVPILLAPTEAQESISF